MDTDTRVGEAARPAPQARSVLAVRRHPVVFNGTGAEYFRIWIVNLLLTLLTAGIYSAWAKVRKLQYFYRNTEVDGSVFDYHGRPIAILKGRIVAVLLLGFYNFAFQFSFLLGLFAVALLAVLLPWLLTQSQKFKLYYSSYRGLRFHFSGPLREAYFIWGLPFVLLMIPITLGGTVPSGARPPTVVLIGFGLTFLALLLLVPYLHYRIKRFQHAHAHFGRSAGRFHGKSSRFYWIYLQATLLIIAVGVIAGVLFAVFGLGAAATRGPAAAAIVGVLIMIAFYLVVLSVTPFVNARVQNYVWNNTLLGLVGFDSVVKARRLAFIYITNLLLIIVTFSLYIPFAVVRMLKYRLTCVTVLSTDDLQGFVAQQAAMEVAATGEGAADLLDFDFSL